jgi:16S rRNA (cytosine1402-N4)-methyltransferase
MSSTDQDSKAKHVPVLLNESLKCLQLSKGDVFLDGTLGSAGHSAAVAQQWGRTIEIIGLDQDAEALKRSERVLSSLEANYRLKQTNFRRLDEVASELGILSVDAILLDIGFSSDQLENSGKGFSFLHDEPLDMRMSGQGVTAAQILNTFDEDTLELILRGFGEERYSRRIAKAIVEKRQSQPLETTSQFVHLIEEAVPIFYRKGRIHPATRSFQAVRIATNDELAALEEGLEKGFNLLKSGGRFVIISFHSLEDRIVKNLFRQLVRDEKAEFLTKAGKPLTAQKEETEKNPRARSAKLRAIKKL